jgi:cytochrome P450
MAVDGLIDVAALNAASGTELVQIFADLASPMLVHQETANLRVGAPAKMTALRYVVEDIELGGAGLRAGDVVAVLIAAANQDPRRFPAGACPRPAEPGGAHVAFGAGVHFCVGAPSARLAAQIAFRGLLGRFTGFEVTVPRTELAWKDSMFVRGLLSLPIRYHAV